MNLTGALLVSAKIGESPSHTLIYLDHGQLFHSEPDRTFRKSEPELWNSGRRSDRSRLDPSHNAVWGPRLFPSGR